MTANDLGETLKEFGDREVVILGNDQEFLKIVKISGDDKHVYISLEREYEKELLK